MRQEVLMLGGQNAALERGIVPSAILPSILICQSKRKINPDGMEKISLDGRNIFHANCRWTTKDKEIIEKSGDIYYAFGKSLAATLVDRLCGILIHSLCL